MNRRWLIYGTILLFSLAVLSACDLFDNGGEVPETNDKYLISYSNVSSYPEAVVKLVLQLFETKFPEAAEIRQKVSYGLWVYTVNYKTSYKNQEVEASGLVCLPIGTGTFPLLSFQNGTNTLHSAAPSVNYNDSLFLMVEAIASTGFIVAFPDYLGFGTSNDMVHPYLHKESTVQSVTDMLRAVREMVSRMNNISLSKDTYLMGYSLGGWASMALKSEMEKNLSAEFNLKASSCGAGPYDLTEVSRNILEKETYQMPYFMAYITDSYIRTGEITLSYADIFNPPYSGTGYISSLFNGNNNSEYINSMLSTTIDVLFTQDFLENYATGGKYVSLHDALVRNSVEAWNTTSPTLIIHGLGDTFVTPAASDNMYQAFLTSGVSQDIVTYMPLPGLDHQEAVLPWGVKSLNYILGKRGS